MSKVGIVLVNYNGGRFLPECLETLFAGDYPRMEVVLVDNGSSDGSPGWVRQSFPQVAVLALGANRGFTGGCNAGIAWCRENGCASVLLLNNDTAVAPDFLSRLMQHAAPDRLLVPKIYFYDRRTVINNHLGTFDFRLGIHRDWFYGRLDTERSRRLQEVPMANGCALLIPEEVFRQIGLLDDQFFMYAEDVDFITRAVHAGFRVLFVPDAVIYHRESASSGGSESPLSVYYATRNRLHLMKKYQTSRWRLAVFWVYFLLTRFVVAARYLRHGQIAQFHALQNAVVDFWRGQVGQAPEQRYQQP